MSADLDQAVYGLLTPARYAIDRHGNDGQHRCRGCGLPWPCFELGTAIAALDLVLRVHVAARRPPDGSTPTSALPTSRSVSISSATVADDATTTRARAW